MGYQSLGAFIGCSDRAHGIGSSYLVWHPSNRSLTLVHGFFPQLPSGGGPGGLNEGQDHQRLPVCICPPLGQGMTWLPKSESIAPFIECYVPGNVLTIYIPLAQ